MAVTRIKKSFTNIPKQLSEAVQFVISIGEKQRLINQIKRDAKEKIDEINAKMKADLKDITQERDTFFNGLFAYAQPRKQSLTAELRTIFFPSGSFGWRWTPPSVSINNGMTDADVIAYLEKKGLVQYVRTVKEVNREMLLNDKPAIPFISYTQREEFFAKPKMGKGTGKAEELSVKTDAIDV